MEAIKKDNKKAVEQLFNAGAHFAYTKARRHPSAKSFIFGAKNKIEIFDLEKTNEALVKALSFVSDIGAARGTILFVGGKNEAREAVIAGATAVSMPYVAGRWIGGTLTNFTEIRKRVMKLETLLTQKEKGELIKYTKKERLLIDRDIDKLKRFFEGLALLKDRPKALFVIDSKKEHIAVQEARDLGIPVIALTGSDCDLKEVTYPIPANDSSKQSIAFFVAQVVDAYKAGLAKGPAPVAAK